MDNYGDPVETDQNQAENVINFKRKIALFLLKLRECNKLPSNAILNVVKEMTETLCYHRAEVLDSILKHLGQKGLDRDLINSVKDAFNCQTQTEMACNDLNTEYKLNKCIREHFWIC